MYSEYEKRLRFILDGANVRRYHTKPTVMIETNGHHSHGVACLLNLLYPDCRKELLIAALYHDLGEQESGDLPGTMKRETGIRNAVKMYEKKLHDEAGLPIPMLDEEEQRRMSFCDAVQGAFFCLEECERGNVRVMKPLYLRYLSWIKNLARLTQENNIYDYLNDTQYAGRGV